MWCLLHKGRTVKFGSGAGRGEAVATKTIGNSQ